MRLDHKDRQMKIIPDSSDKSGQFIRLLRIHACRRFVQKKQTWLCGQGSGDLQASLFAVRKGCGHLITHIIQLQDMQQLDVWFPELGQLIGVEQDPVYHPEGDVWVHTMEVVDRAAVFRDRVAEPYAFMLLALTHDMGKAVTTEYIKGRIHAYEHETKGLPAVQRFLERITGDKSVTGYVLNMVPLHMRPNIAAFSRPAVKSTNRMFDEACAPEDLIWFAEADRPLFSGSEAFTGDRGFLLDRLEVYRRTMAKPYVMGRDLIEAGLEPGEYYSELLAYAHKLRLAGIEKDAALKQVLAYARKKRFGQ